MKRIILVLMLSGTGSLTGMQSPSKITGKRRGQELQELPAKSPAVADESEANLPDLPLELQTRILYSILNVSGPTNTAKLYKAAQNLRNYMKINKSYYAWLNTPVVVNSMIRDLAKWYTADNDFIAVVLALATNSASKWLASRIQDALAPQEQGQVAPVNQRGMEFILKVLEYLRSAFINTQIDHFILLTQHIEPSRKAWLINNLTISGLPVLSYLIFNNRTKMFDMLLALDGIDLDREDSNGNTPVIMAVSVKNNPALQKLVAQGAQLNVLNVEQETPLMVAIEKQNEFAVQVLSNHSSTDLSAEDYSDDKPLHRAIDIGNKAILDLLLRAGLPDRLDINAQGFNGDTPLIRATVNGNINFIELLLQNGARIDARNDHGETALMFAAQSEQIGPLMLLIERGAPLNERDFEDRTALWHARNKNMQQNIRILEQAGAQE